MLSVDKNNFKKALELLVKYPWIADMDKVNALVNLVCKDCNTLEQQQLIADILSELEHISIRKYNQLLKSLASNIISSSIDPSITFITAMSTGYSADSGQSVLYDLKLEFSRLNWIGYKDVNRFDHIRNKYKKSDVNHQKITVVLVDNFVGTGSTVIGRVKRIKQIFEGAGDPLPDILVRVLISTKGGHDKIISEGINFSFSHQVSDKILEKLYKAEEVDAKKFLMRTIEKKFSTHHNNRPFPSLGYGEAQVALFIENKNTPNNVFPVFWWKYYADNRLRDVLLDRAMDDA